MLELFVLFGAVQQAMLKNRIHFPLADTFLMIPQRDEAMPRAHWWEGSWNTAVRAEALMGSFWGCWQDICPKAGKKEGGREKNWKITIKKTTSFLKLETLRRFMNLWVYETTLCFGVCCWTNLTVQSMVVVSLHFKKKKEKKPFRIV